MLIMYIYIYIYIQCIYRHILYISYIYFLIYYLYIICILSTAMGFGIRIRQCRRKCLPMLVLRRQKKCCRKGFRICKHFIQTLNGVHILLSHMILFSLHIVRIVYVFRTFVIVTQRKMF